MAHNNASRMKLNKEQLVRITSVYQGKFIGLHLWIKNDLSGIKSDFSKLEALEYVTWNVNTKLSERLVTMERRCYVKEQLEISVSLQMLLIMTFNQMFWEF